MDGSAISVAVGDGRARPHARSLFLRSVVQKGGMCPIIARLWVGEKELCNFTGFSRNKASNPHFPRLD